MTDFVSCLIGYLTQVDDLFKVSSVGLQHSFHILTPRSCGLTIGIAISIARSSRFDSEQQWCKVARSCICVEV